MLKILHLFVNVFIFNVEFVWFSEHIIEHLGSKYLSHGYIFQFVLFYSLSSFSLHPPYQAFSFAWWGWNLATDIFAVFFLLKK